MSNISTLNVTPRCGLPTMHASPALRCKNLSRQSCPKELHQNHLDCSELKTQTRGPKLITSTGDSAQMCRSETIMSTANSLAVNAQIVKKNLLLRHDSRLRSTRSLQQEKPHINSELPHTCEATDMCEATDNHPRLCWMPQTHNPNAAEQIACASPAWGKDG